MMNQFTLRASTDGFSMVEVLATMAIVAIVVAMAVPYFQAFIYKNEASSYANELGASINLARSEAIKRSRTVSVCSSSDVTAAAPVCAVAANPTTATFWTDGWLVFVDQATIGTFDAGDTLLKVGQPTSTSGVVITTDATQVFADYISYNSMGQASQGAGSLFICVGAVAGQLVGTPRAINISTTGRISITNVSGAGAAAC